MPTISSQSIIYGIQFSCYRSRISTLERTVLLNFKTFNFSYSFLHINEHFIISLLMDMGNKNKQEGWKKIFFDPSECGPLFEKFPFNAMTWSTFQKQRESKSFHLSQWVEILKIMICHVKRISVKEPLRYQVLKVKKRLFLGTTDLHLHFSHFHPFIHKNRDMLPVQFLYSSWVIFSLKEFLD